MVESVTEKLARLEQAQKEVDDIVLGRWDFSTGKRQLGIAERLDLLTDQVNLLADQLKLIVKILKYGLGPLITVCTIASVGTSAKEIVPSIVKVAIQIIGLH